MVAHNTTITPKASAKKARKGHSTDVIGNASIVEIAMNSTKAEVSSNFSSYQTLKTDVNLRRNYASTKLNKKLALMSVNSCRPVNNIDLSTIMLVNCCVRWRRERGTMAAVGRRRPPWSGCVLIN